jgi:hypothetical protein
MSSVIAALACPSIRWTALTLAPADTARLAAVCPGSWAASPLRQRLSRTSRGEHADASGSCRHCPGRADHRVPFLRTAGQGKSTGIPVAGRCGACRRREPRHRNCKVNLDNWTGIVRTYISNRSKRGVPVAIINWTRHRRCCRVQSNFVKSRLTLRRILRSPDLPCDSTAGCDQSSRGASAALANGR